MVKQRGGTKRKTPPHNSRSPLPATKTKMKNTLSNSAPDLSEKMEETINSSTENSTIDSRSNTPTSSMNSDTTNLPTIKIPQIFIKSSSWRKIALKLMETIPENSVIIKAHGTDSVKLTCIDVDLFRIVQKYFQKNKVEYHTLPLQEEKSLKLVIKGLPSDITESELQDELEDKGYTIKSIRQFSNATRKYPIYMITLPLNPLNKQLFSENSLFYIPIKVESYRSNRPAQCYSCQRFGHSSFHCGYAPRCVKCAGEHHAKDCAKIKEEDPKCANCGGTHTANYSKCPAQQRCQKKNQ